MEIIKYRLVHSEGYTIVALVGENLSKTKPDTDQSQDILNQKEKPEPMIVNSPYKIRVVPLLCPSIYFILILYSFILFICISTFIFI